MREWGGGVGGSVAILLFLVGLTAGLPPPVRTPPATSLDDKPPDPWDGQITYDYTRHRTGGTYGGKITEPLGNKAVEEKREASCPPPTNRCLGPLCQSDSDCPKAGSACCFNGCIKTCSFLVDPPAVVDWLEESPSLGPALYDKEESSEEETLLERVAPPDVVTLDGCILTPKQKEHLDELRQSSSIGSCFCEDGDVSCHVQHKDEAVRVVASPQRQLLLRNT